MDFVGKFARHKEVIAITLNGLIWPRRLGKIYIFYSKTLRAKAVANAIHIVRSFRPRRI